MLRFVRLHVRLPVVAPFEQFTAVTALMASLYRSCPLTLPDPYARGNRCAGSFRQMTVLGVMQIDGVARGSWFRETLGSQSPLKHLLRTSREVPIVDFLGFKVWRVYKV